MGRIYTSLVSFIPQPCDLCHGGSFPAGVYMSESNAQIEGALRSPREQTNTLSYIAQGVQNATNFNGN